MALDLVTRLRKIAGHELDHPAAEAADEIERLTAALKRYEDLKIHLSTGGKPDERIYTRKDVQMLVAVCRAGEKFT